MAVRQSVRSIVHTLKKDSRYRRLEQAFNELPIYRIPVDDLLEEIERMHKMRPVRTLRSEDARFIDKAIEACVRDQSCRSRCAEINVMCIKARASLEKATSKLREYMLVRYAQEIAVMRTREERVNLINTVLSTFLKFVHQVSIVESCSAVILDDIDKAAWMFKGVVAAYGLQNRTESL